MTNLRTPLSLAKGDGASGAGTHHFWLQRLTSVALIPLVIWFCFSIATIAQLDHAGISRFLASTGNSVMMVCSLVAIFLHAALGLQVVVEDYVKDRNIRLVTIVAVKLLCTLLAIAGVFSVVKISFGS